MLQLLGRAGRACNDLLVQYIPKSSQHSPTGWFGALLAEDCVHHRLLLGIRSSAMARGGVQK